MLSINNQNLCDFCFEKFPTKVKICPYCSDFINNDSTYPSVGTILAARYLVGRYAIHSYDRVCYYAYDLMQNKRVLIEEIWPFVRFIRNQNDKDLHVVFYDGSDFEKEMLTFVSKARRFTRLNKDPNIVSIYDLFYENNTYYAVTEYFSGKSLSDFSGITENEALYILKHVANSLLGFHDLSGLYLHIMPDNIVVSDNGIIKLQAFSASDASWTANCAFYDKYNGGNSYQPHLEHNRFMPTEINGKNRGPWTDIYSLGATVYHSLRPNTLEFPTFRQINESLNLSGLTPSFADILKKMLEIYPKDRYQSIPELKKDLETLKIKPIAPKIK